MNRLWNANNFHDIKKNKGCYIIELVKKLFPLNRIFTSI